MTDLVPIPTTYNGVRYRSRLEARWALFFDELGIRHEYEPEAFLLQDGSGYLPDFWLPDMRKYEPGECAARLVFTGVYAEVKPRHDPFEKAQAFVMQHGRPVWLLSGPPDFCLMTLACRLGDADDTWFCGEEVIVSANQSLHSQDWPNEYFDSNGRFRRELAFPRVAAAIDAVRAHRFWDPKGGHPCSR